MKGEVRFRLIRADDVPPSHAFLEEEVEFGLQDTKGVVVPGVRGPKGEFVFDFVLTVRDGVDASTRRLAGGLRVERRTTDLCICRGGRCRVAFGSIA